MRAFDSMTPVRETHELNHTCRANVLVAGNVLALFSRADYLEPVNKHARCRNQWRLVEDVLRNSALSTRHPHATDSNHFSAES